MKLNWILVCVDNNIGEDKMAVVKHVCAYESEPRDVDIESLKQELNTDEDFGMIGDTNYIIMKYNRVENQDIFEILELPEELSE
jgi:hypothetical protein